MDIFINNYNNTYINYNKYFSNNINKSISKNVLDYIYIKGLYIIQYVFILLSYQYNNIDDIVSTIDKLYMYYIEFINHIDLSIYNNTCNSLEFNIKDAILFSYKKIIFNNKINKKDTNFIDVLILKKYNINNIILVLQTITNLRSIFFSYNNYKNNNNSHSNNHSNNDLENDSNNNDYNDNDSNNDDENVNVNVNENVNNNDDDDDDDDDDDENDNENINDKDEDEDEDENDNNDNEKKNHDNDNDGMYMNLHFENKLHIIILALIKDNYLKNIITINKIIKNLKSKKIYISIKDYKRILNNIITELI